MTQHIQHADRGALGAQLTVAQQISLIVGVAVLVLSLVRVQHLRSTVDHLASEQVERLQRALR